MIPLEVRHVYHRPTIGGFVILAMNCFIVWFLYRVLKREKHHVPAVLAPEVAEIS